MKPTLLYVSPFWPQRSGISEYSETLVWGLKEYFDIVILTKKKIDNSHIKKEFETRIYRKDEDYSGYDYIIYNFGNSPDNHDYMYNMLKMFPGYVILHDFSLYYLTVDHYRERDILFQKIYELEGIQGIVRVKDSIKEKGIDDLIQHKDLPPLLPLNKEVLHNATGVIVHSDYVREKVHSVNSEVPICKIELVDCMPNVTFDDDDYLRKKYKFEQDDFIIGAVGMIALSKQNKITCEAVKVYNQTHKKKMKYVMIGAGDYVDSYLDKNIVKTGFLENHEFFNAIKSCNVIFNLRKPYNGESSATLMQCMLMGKHCLVTDIGWFNELPDDCVIKVSEDITVNELVRNIEECMQLSTLNEKGKKFVAEKCNSKAVAEDIKNFLVQQL